MQRNSGNTSISAGTVRDSTANEAALTDQNLTTGLVRFSDFIDRERRKNAKPGAIYYVSFGEGGPVKIGFVSSFFALGERLRGLQTACPYPLILLAVRAGSTYHERRLHERFASKRMAGEWFERHPMLMQHIAGVARRKDCREVMPRHARYAPPK